MKRTICVLSLVAAVFASAERRGHAQVQPSAGSAAGVVTGSCHISPIVAKIEATVPFYRDVIGLEFPAPPPSGEWPFDKDPVLMDIHGLPGARLRFVSARVPGGRCGIELVDFADADRRPVTSSPEDPGAVTIVLLARDLDAIAMRAKQSRVRMVTRGGAPVLLETDQGPARAIVMTDPDGHFVEIRQLETAPATTAPPDSNIIGARLRITVSSTERTLALYRDQLGFTGRAGEFISNEALAQLLGLNGAEVRESTVQVPGSPLVLEVLELRKTGRATRPRIQDPGAMRLQLSVRDAERVARALEAGGGTVVSTGGRVFTYTTAPARPGVPFELTIVRDTESLYLVLMQGPRAGAGSPPPDR